MSLTHRCGNWTRALSALVVLGTFAGFVLAETPAFNSPPVQSWTVHRPNIGKRLPLARLIRNPDDPGTGPQYALADQTGHVQRYVEPVPGIDLEPYVGYAVMIRHDTGRTLLASQLDLPGQERDSILESGS